MEEHKQDFLTISDIALGFLQYMFRAKNKTDAPAFNNERWGNLLFYFIRDFKEKYPILAKFEKDFVKTRNGYKNSNISIDLMSRIPRSSHILQGIYPEERLVLFKSRFMLDFEKKVQTICPGLLKDFWEKARLYEGFIRE